MKYVVWYFGIGASLSILIFLCALWKRRDQLSGVEWAEPLLKLTAVVIVWPLFLRPSILKSLLETILPDRSGVIQLKKLFEAKRQAAIHPPYCSSTITFDASKPYDSNGAQGLFLFSADEVEQTIHELVSRHPHLLDDDEGGLLAWLRQRNENDASPVEVPDLWPRIINSVDTLVRSGSGTVHCPSCGRDYSVRQLTFKDDTGLAGWNHNELYCTAGHLLLRRKRIRFFKSRG